MANNDPRDPERYARQSFSMRPAASWQVWLMTAAAVLILIGLLAAMMG